jgi:DNA repair ATPase RecN
LAGEIRRRHQRAPDTGDLLLVLAGAPDTIAGRALRELEGDLKALPDLVERLRDQARADDPLARQLDALIQAREQAVEQVAQLRAQERKLREQTEARTAIGAQALQTIRTQLGVSLPADNPPQPPQAS